MKDTAEESADLKMALKHDPVTQHLHTEAKAHPQEADEAIEEVQRGRDNCHPDSWVAWWFARTASLYRQDARP